MCVLPPLLLLLRLPDVVGSGRNYNHSFFVRVRRHRWPFARARRDCSGDKVADLDSAEMAPMGRTCKHKCSASLLIQFCLIWLHSRLEELGKCLGVKTMSTNNPGTGGPSLWHCGPWLARLHKPGPERKALSVRQIGLITGIPKVAGDWTGLWQSRNSLIYSFFMLEMWCGCFDELTRETRMGLLG